jgi:3-hydroxyisobutyrate dehydrogenase-like beta-hydroxyacid dehydrogenase
MGRRIARRLFDAKVDLTIWNRTASAASGLTELGHELRQAMQRYSAAREAGLGSANLVAIAKLMR